MPAPSGVVDPNRIYDGFGTLEGGVDSGRSPNLIEPNQVSTAENMVFRGGRAKTRPGIRLIGDFTNILNPNHSYWGANPPTGKITGDDAGDVIVPGEDAQSHILNGVFQVAHYYAPPNGQACIMALIDGRLYKIVPSAASTISVEEIVLPRRLTSGYQYGWMCQADKWLIVQDGICAPILYDGSKARASKTEAVGKYGPEVPVGTIMTYGLGRLVVVLPGNRNIRFGDLYGSHSDSIDAGDSVIRFEETTFLAEGFDAALPFDMGQITGASFFPQLDTSTGNGPLLVFAEKGAAGFFLEQPRTQWQFSTFEQLALLSTGLRGDRSIVAVNEDLWFRADDGWRTYRQARSEASGWAHIPLSTNIRQYVANDTPELLNFVNAIYFDNRLIGMTEPQWNFQATGTVFDPVTNVTSVVGKGRPAFNRQVVCDFDILSSFGTRNKPAWDGVWKPPNTLLTQVVTGIFNGEKRAFAFGVNTAPVSTPLDEIWRFDISINNYYQLFKTTFLMQVLDGGGVPHQWSYVTPSAGMALADVMTGIAQAAAASPDSWISSLLTFQQSGNYLLVHNARTPYSNNASTVYAGTNQVLIPAVETQHWSSTGGPVLVSYQNVFFEISLDDRVDYNNTDIPWQFESRDFDFARSGGGSSVFNETELYDADIWLSDMSSLDNPITASYKPDNYPYWIPWKSFSGKFGLIGFQGSVTPGAVPTATPGFSPRVSLGKPPYQGDFKNTNRNLRRGYRFQVKLNGVGHVQIDQFRLHAQKTVEKSLSAQPPSS